MIMNEEDLLESEKFLIHARYLFKIMNQQIMRDLKTYQVDASEMIGLVLLHCHPKGLSMTEVTNLSMTDKSMTTKVMNKLEKKGYIYRDRESSTKRNYKVYLTDLGISKAMQVENLLQRKEKCFQSNFTEEEQRILRQAWQCLLRKYI